MRLQELVVFDGGRPFKVLEVVRKGHVYVPRGAIADHYNSLITQTLIDLNARRDEEMRIGSDLREGLG